MLPSSEKKWVSCIIEQMKSKNVILLILVALLVFPSNAILAIGNRGEKHSIEKSCCCNTSSSTGEKSCCSSSDENQEKNNCGSNCGDNSCHCPIPICIPLFVENTVFSTRKLFATPNLGWMYLQSIPKAISISIWQPPKIG